MCISLLPRHFVWQAWSVSDWWWDTQRETSVYEADMCTVPGPQSMAFSCFPDSKSHILIWLSSELDAATINLHYGQGFVLYSNVTISYQVTYYKQKFSEKAKLLVTYSTVYMYKTLSYNFCVRMRPFHVSRVHTCTTCSQADLLIYLLIIFIFHVVSPISLHCDIFLKY